MNGTLSNPYRDALLRVFAPLDTKGILAKANSRYKTNPFQVNIEQGAVMYCGSHRAEARFARPDKAALAKFVNLLAASAEDAQALLQGRLTPAVEQFAKASGIEIVPSNKYLVSAKCSCGRTSALAGLCPHISQLINRVAEEAPAKPLTLFSMQGVDLAALLRAKGIRAQAPASVVVPFSKVAAYAVEALDATLRTAPANDTVVPAENLTDALANLDFSRLKPATADPFEVFGLGAPFEKASDRSQVYAKRAKALAKYLKLCPAFDFERAPEIKEERPEFTPAAEVAHALLGPAFSSVEVAFMFTPGTLSGRLYVTRVTPAGGKEDAETGHLPFTSFTPEAFFKIFEKFDPARASLLPANLRVWFEAWRIAGLLFTGRQVLPLAAVLEEGAALPQLFYAANVTDDDVATLVADFSRALAFLPTDTVHRGNEPAARHLEAALDLTASKVFERVGELAPSAADILFSKLYTRQNALVMIHAAILAHLRQIQGNKAPTGYADALELGWLNELFKFEVDGENMRSTFNYYGVYSHAALCERRHYAQVAYSGERSVFVFDMGLIRSGTRVSLRAISPDDGDAGDLLERRERVAELFAPARDLKTGGKVRILSLEEVRDFLYDVAPRLRTMGVTVLLPENLKRVANPKVRVRASLATPGTSTLSAKAIGDFSWKVAVGGHEIDESAFREMVESGKTFFELGRDIVHLDMDDAKSILALLASKRKPTSLERFRAVLIGEIDGAQVTYGDDVKTALAKLTDVTDRPVPPNLKATLRPYQERGYAWLMKNMDLGVGSLIADDMGLGKTLQVIAALLALKNEGRLSPVPGKQALVVVPTTLMLNWKREVERFAPDLTLAVYHGTSRELAPADVIVTSYGCMRRDADLLVTRNWSVLVLDEAQALKNHLSQQARAVRRIEADHRIAMSGTPVENRLLELRSVMDVVEPGLLGGSTEFVSRFAVPIEVKHDGEALAKLKRLVAPFMIRRTKTDKNVIADLPERSATDIFVSLTPEQAALYQNAVNAYFAEGRAEEERGIVRRGRILKLIGELKAICNSPSQFLETRPPEPDCAKAKSMIELVDSARESSRKVIVFTQFLHMGERIAAWLQPHLGTKPDFLHGGVTPAARQAMVERFQNDPAVDVIVVSLRAGGTGLNLTAGSVVIHYDLWWNPAVEAQATDRAYRIGQTRDVLVYRFVTAGTFEDRINEMLERKKALSEQTLSEGETWLGDMSDDDLREFVCLTEGVGN